MIGECDWSVPCALPHPALLVPAVIVAPVAAGKCFVQERAFKNLTGNCRSFVGVTALTEHPGSGRAAHEHSAAEISRITSSRMQCATQFAPSCCSLLRASLHADRR